MSILTSPSEGLVAGALLVAVLVTSGALAKRSVKPDVEGEPVKAEEWIGVVRPTDVATVAAPTAVTVAEVLVSMGDELAAGQPLVRRDSAEDDRQLAELEIEIERVKQQIDQYQTAIDWRDANIRQLRSKSADGLDQLAVAEREAQQIPLRQAKDSPERARVAYEQAQQKVRRSEELAAAGLVARQEVDEARFSMRLAEDDLANARQAAEVATRVGVAQAQQLREQREQTIAEQQRELAEQQAMLEQARLQLKSVSVRYDTIHEAISDPFIRAPRAGVALELPVSAGDRLSAGALVAKIARLDPMAVDVDVPPLVANALHAGETARVDVTAAQVSGCEARIQSIAPLPNDAGKYTIRLLFANPSHARLAGQAAQVSLAAVESRPR